MKRPSIKGNKKDIVISIFLEKKKIMWGKRPAFISGQGGEHPIKLRSTHSLRENRKQQSKISED